MPDSSAHKPWQSHGFAGFWHDDGGSDTVTLLGSYKNCNQNALSVRFLLAKKKTLNIKKPTFASERV
jgi:hypothetical protein